MSNKMLIDAAHPEETRVVVLRGNRVEEFDFEAASKKPLRGNIYLAKVTRVEPSLQAAFIEYGGNRHGFLAFSEVHPDYYQIPVADRQALLEEEARAHREEEDESRGGQSRRSRRHRRGSSSEKRATSGDESLSETAEEFEGAADQRDENEAADIEDAGNGADVQAVGEAMARTESASEAEPGLPLGFDAPAESAAEPIGSLDRHPDTIDEGGSDVGDEPASESGAGNDREADGPSENGAEGNGSGEDEEPIEQIGGDALDDTPYRAPRMRRNYKIQEVIKRRQILLVQVVKEERGNKGAALTTYLSLAGRYSVLMPNTARGGGISRKITDNDDRKRLKSIAQSLDVPEGMGVILRTAGAARGEGEVARDFEYLLRMWETIRETTLRSSAPALVYEEGSLIKRAIRDLYNRDMEEVCVSGEAAYREAKEFMRLLMPSHAKNVKLYDDSQPIFAKSGAEAQLDAMFSNHVTLRSGGYLVINQTEALVAIDVNSGRSTREHNIEDTALRTNLEAADEVARQLRLRDLAGLIVVDFIDMEESRNNRAVERRIKDALKNDRARIQIGRISHFGLLEMSRQRIRTGVLEGSTVLCPHCAGAGTVRSTASIALHVLRVLEDTLIRNAEFNLIVRTRLEVALYMLNTKRAHLSDLEERYGVSLSVMADATLTGTIYHAIERGEAATPPVTAFRKAESAAEDLLEVDEDLEVEDEAEEDVEASGEEVADDAGQPAEGRRGDRDDQNGGRRRRRRRRRGRDRDPRGAAPTAQDGQPLSAEESDLGDEGGDGDFADEATGDEPVSAIPASDDGVIEAPPTAPLGLPDEEPVAQPVAESSPPASLTAEEPAAPLDPETAADPIEQPRRRRVRRASTRSAPLTGESTETQAENPAAELPAAEEPAATPRRSRRSRSRLVESEAPSTFNFEAEAAEGQAPSPVTPPADAPSEPPAPVAVEAAPVAVAPEPAQTAEPPASAAAAPVETQPVPEPVRPKRSGWWQRAKATLTGE